jgi:hypothetical protein
VCVVYENFRCLRKIANSNCQLLHVCLSLRPSFCLSVRMEELGTHLTASHELWNLAAFRKIKKNSTFVKSLVRMYIYDSISLTSSKTEKRFRWKLSRTSKYTFYVQ